MASTNRPGGDHDDRTLFSGRDGDFGALRLLRL
jgi:hypothetical protein